MPFAEIDANPRTRSADFQSNIVCRTQARGPSCGIGALKKAIPGRRLLLLTLVLLVFIGPFSAIADGPIINEFVALNKTALRDEDGDSSDWIEILNNSTSAVNLLGWHLTDNRTQPAKWTFPDTPLSPGQFLVVFASGKDRAISGHELHTNFKLDNAGEYLALTRPDNSVASEFAPQYPPQGPDIGYGRGTTVLASLDLLSEGSSLRYFVPTNDNLGDTWIQPSFDSSSWSNGPTPLGFDTAGAFRSYADLVLADEPLYYWNFDEPSGPALNQANPDLVQDALTPEGGATRVAQTTLPLGSAASFDGASGTRFYAGSPSIGSDLIGPWAVEFWVRNLDSSKQTYFVAASTVGGNHNSPGLIEGYNGAALELFGAGGRTGAAGPTLTDTNWHHLVFGYYGSAAGEGLANRSDIYIDGVLVSARTNDFPSALPFGGGSVAVGATVGSAVQNVLGQMDEVAVYDLRGLPSADAMVAKLWSIASNHYHAVITANFGSAFTTDLTTQMAARASSFYVRHEFVLTNVSGINRLTLRVKADDGFVAWLNGVRVAAANAPQTVAFDSTALTNRPSREATTFQSFDLSAFAGLLATGTNVLALQGLNTSTTYPDFLLSAELSAAEATTEIGYLLTPTPDAPNGDVVRRLGPLISDVTDNPPRPRPART